jgi:hypothetical protein
MRLVHPDYHDSPINSAFATDVPLAEDPRIAAWIYGHTHKPNFGPRFFCNPIGYPSENPRAAPDRVLEITIRGEGAEGPPGEGAPSEAARPKRLGAKEPEGAPSEAARPKRLGAKEPEGAPSEAARPKRLGAKEPGANATPPPLVEEITERWEKGLRAASLG